MPSLSTAVDSGFLSSYGFFKHYDTYRDRLIAIARQTYRLLATLSGLVPERLDCAPHLELALLGDTTFADIIADICAAGGVPGSKDSFWVDFFAGPVARHLLSQEWPEITK
jgi:hypothetical protein